MRLEDSERARTYTGEMVHGPGCVFDVVWNFARRRVPPLKVSVRDANLEDRMRRLPVHVLHC